MDKIDVEILSILQENARIANVDIARKIGKAPSVVLERIRKLETQGIIRGYYSRLDETVLNFSLLAYIWLKTRPSISEHVSRLLHDIPEIQEVHEVAGDEDYLIKVRARDTKDLANFLKNRLGNIKEIQSTRTTIVLMTVKDTDSLPLSSDED